MPRQQKSNLVEPIRKNVISAYAAQKVVDWVLKRKVDQGMYSSFAWSSKDKITLQKAIFESRNLFPELPVDEPKFKRFFQTVIENGLNSDDVVLFQRYKQLLPLRSLGLVYDLRDFDIIRSNLQSIEKIDSGYYMLEITIDPKIYSSQLLIQLETADDQSSFVLQARSQHVTKRLIKLEKDQRVTIMSDSQWHPNEITYFRLAKLTKNFFLDRLHKKIGRKVDILNNDTLTDIEIDSVWWQYDRLFSTKLISIKGTYHERVSEVERETIPAEDEQVRSVMKWLSRKL